MKLTLLAAVLVVIGSSAVIAGRDKTPIPKSGNDKPAGMNCCVMGRKAPAPFSEKEVPSKSGMSCHRNAAAAKSCCK